MMILVWIIVGYLVYDYLKKNNVSSGTQENGSAMEVLKQRYVNGEIDEETFQRLSKTIKD